MDPVTIVMFAGGRLWGGGMDLLVWSGLGHRCGGGGGGLGNVCEGRESFFGLARLCVF